MTAPTPLPLRLAGAAEWFDAAVRARLQVRNGVALTPGQLRVLSALGPEGSSVAGLARRVGVTRQSMHRTVGELSDLGLLTVTVSEADRRERMVTHTRVGSALARRAAHELAAVEQELGGRIGADPVRALRAALDEDWGPPPVG